MQREEHLPGQLGSSRHGQGADWQGLGEGAAARSRENQPGSQLLSSALAGSDPYLNNILSLFSSFCEQMHTTKDREMVVYKF